LPELDRCREMVLLIPAPTHETHFAINNAVNAIWDLRETLRYLLSPHRDMQRSFATKGEALTSSQLNPRRDPPNPPLRAVGEASTEGKRKRVHSSSGRSRPSRYRVRHWRSKSGGSFRRAPSVSRRT